MDEKKREFVLVGYYPQGDRRLPPGTKVLLDNVMSAAFDVSLETASIIDPEILGRHLASTDTGSWPSRQSKVKAQIMVQSGVTDVHTAEVLADFYTDVEHRRWESVLNVLTEDLEFSVPDVFQTVPTANTRDLFLSALKRWSFQYSETMVDIEWANISTNHAMVKFGVWCLEDKIVDALSEYKFVTIDGEVKLTSIYNHGINTEPLPIFGGGPLPEIYRGKTNLGGL